MLKIHDFYILQLYLKVQFSFFSILGPSYSKSFLFFNNCWCTKLLIFLSNTTLLYDIYEGWNFNSGNYLFRTDTK